MSREKTRKYLLYAVGEIFLVVIGILIALQINNWNEDRLERQQEREYLASMLNDLQVDTERIDAALNGNAILLDRLDRLLGLISERTDDEAHLRELFKHALAYTYWYLRVDFSEVTMSQLKSSGGLLLIRDKQVRDAMLKYEQGLEACKHQYTEMTTYFHVIEETQKRLFDLGLGKPAYEFIEEDFLRILEPPGTFEPLILKGSYLIDNDPILLARYYNDVLFYRTALNNTNLFLEEQQRLAGALAQLIQSQ